MLQRVKNVKEQMDAESDILEALVEWFLSRMMYLFALAQSGWANTFICKPSAFMFESTFLTGLLERCHLSSTKIPTLCETANKASQSPNSAEVFPTGTSLNSASDAQAKWARGSSVLTHGHISSF